MIRLIAAIDQARGIAKAGQQPWHIPADEQYFREQTTKFGARVLMGRKTYEVIGRVLPLRTNYVLTHSRRAGPGIIAVSDVDAFLHTESEDIWVIGGAEVYRQTIALADELYLTLVQSDFACDQFFPPYESQFELISKGPVQKEDGLGFVYAIYRRQL